MFLEFAEGKVSAEVLATIDWDTWYKGNGLPPVTNTFDDTLQKQCKALADKWVSGEGSSADDAKGIDSKTEFNFDEGWFGSQFEVFLDILGEAGLDKEKVAKLDSVFHFRYADCV